MRLSDQTLLRAARAEHIPVGRSGPWAVRRLRCTLATQAANRAAGRRVVPIGTYTVLTRLTSWEPFSGETVMSDEPYELGRHLWAMRRARGRVLVTGLGLGCVVRGMLANPAVDHIDLIERDGDVLELVREHMPEGRRLSIRHAEAVSWVEQHASVRWDFAWHDLWSDHDAGEEHLAITHQRLMIALRNSVPPREQGAWAFPKNQRRALARIGV